jgi:hypothetical protein
MGEARGAAMTPAPRATAQSAMARLVLTAPMAKVATPELISRLEQALARFPELGDERVTVGVTASRGVDGLAYPSERLIRLNPYRRRMVTYFTIGHELTHLVQPPGLALIPSGEVQCDIWTLARDPLFLDEKPCYLDIACDGRSWRRHAHAVRQLCRRAIDVRRRNRRYIVWLREQLSAYFDRPELNQPSLFDTNPRDARTPTEDVRNPID